MDTKKEPEWQPEEFPEPRTFPGGWDGRALMFSNGHHLGDEAEDQEISNEKEPVWSPEKFPKPRTFPKNWSIEK